MPLLRVTGLRTEFSSAEGVVKAVDGVSFTVDRGEILGLVGESGSGKSVTALSILGLVPNPPGRVVAGEILWDDGEAVDLARAPPSRLRAIRGNRISMIFQDPMTSLNPYLRIGRQLTEVLEEHKGIGGAEARAAAAAMLRRVGIPAPESKLDDYPHHMSGGMRQRVMIAMALLCGPALLLADEPTTALDVTIQAQILDLLLDLRKDTGLAVLLVTHDLGVVARVCDRVAVMYAGRIVEAGTVDDVLLRPKHPYTIGLAESVPRVDAAPGSELASIPGMPPSLARLPPGCALEPRCRFARPGCKVEAPAEREVSPGHSIRCFVDVSDVGVTEPAP